MPRLLFLGDSVTDCARKRARRYQGTPAAQGKGWVHHLDKSLVARYGDLQCWNRGFSGCLIADLMNQPDWWPGQGEGKPEAMELTTLLIGINDIWHPFWHASAHHIDRSLASFRLLLETAQRHSERLVVCQPFALPCGEVSAPWWPLLASLSNGQQAICSDLGVHWLPMQEELLSAAQGKLTDYLIDGVHPTDLGHHWLAGRWLSFVVDKKLLY